MKKRKTKEPEPIPEVIPPEPEQPSQGSRVREGLENLTKAAVLRSEAPDRGAPYDVILGVEAQMLTERGAKALELNATPKKVAGGELVVDEGSDRDRGLASHHGWETRRPTVVAAKASQERMELVDKAKCLALAVDSAEGIENPTALEKMLAHQMAAAHRMSMKLMEKADGVVNNIRTQLDMNYAGLLIGQATRLMTVYQAGLQALVKAKTGGKQEVVVQHVHVNGDGQAVVAGKMDYPKGRVAGGGQDGK